MTKSQLSIVQQERNTLQQNSCQQADLLARAATTLTSLADQMNKVAVVTDKNDSKMTSSSVVAE